MGNNHFGLRTRHMGNNHFGLHTLPAYDLPPNGLSRILPNEQTDDCHRVEDYRLGITYT
jgi:hypothetical protein